jgi:hypothetical protein
MALSICVDTVQAAHDYYVANSLSTSLLPSFFACEQAGIQNYLTRVYREYSGSVDDVPILKPRSSSLSIFCFDVMADILNISKNKNLGGSSVLSVLVDVALSPY